MVQVITISLFILAGFMLYKVIKNNWAKIVAFAGISSLIIGAVWFCYYYGDDAVEASKDAYSFVEDKVDSTKKAVEKSTLAKDAERKAKSLTRSK